jgi:hypothetical protein
MKRFAVLTLGLTVLLVASAGAAGEFTLEEALQAWSFMEGDWTLTSPEGQTFDVSVHLSPAKTAYVSESSQGLHIFGWDPKTKLLEIQSFMPDASRSSALYDRKSDKELLGRDTKLAGSDGTEVTLRDTGVFTLIDKDTWQFAFGDTKWVSRRTPRK